CGMTIILSSVSTAARDGQHGGVVDRVAEDGVRLSDANAGERGGFAFVGGDVEQAVGDDTVLDGDPGGEDTIRWNIEAADAFFDDPVVGGTDGPDLDATGLIVGDEGAEFGEDAG